MRRRNFMIPVLAFGGYILLAPVEKLAAQTPETAQKFDQLAKELSLTPQQKLQVIPILKSEAPQVEAIKSNPGLSRIQKLEQLKAVHDQTDPQIKSILTPAQYQKLQEIRQKEIEDAIRRKRQG